MLSVTVAGEGKLKEGQIFKLTVLQTNDLHGQLDSLSGLGVWDWSTWPPTWIPTLDEEGNPVMHENAIAKYATLIKQVRAGEENVLLVDGGDIFWRGPFAELKGEVENAILKEIGYDAMVLGNNDFRINQAGDGTPEERYEQLKDYHRDQNFPLLCANVIVEETGKYIQNIKAYRNFSFKGVKVAVVGITSMKPEERGFLEVADLDFLDPVSTLGDVITSMNQKSDINLALSHAGNDVDHLLAMVDGVSAVIGADTHKVIATPEFEIRDEQVVPITQAGGEYENYLGRLDLTFQVINGQMQLTDYDGYLYDVTDVEPDPKITKIIEYYRSLLE